MAWTALAINALTPPGTSPAYASQLFRNALSVLIAPHSSGSSRPLGSWSGRRPGAWLVTAATPGGAITIAPGSGVLDVETPVATSAYLTASDANDTSLTLGARHATLDRNDIVSIRIDDTDVDSSGNRQAIPVYTQGTAGGGAPTTPARCLRLCTVLVPSTANGGGTVVTMDQVYAAAAGGALRVASSAAYPSSPTEGDLLYDMALNQLLGHNGTLFAPVGARRVAGTTFATDLTSSGSTETVGYSQSINAVNGHRYRVWFNGYVLGGATAGQGAIRLRQGTGSPSTSWTQIGDTFRSICVSTSNPSSFFFFREFVAASTGALNVGVGVATATGSGNTAVNGTTIATEITIDDVTV